MELTDRQKNIVSFIKNYYAKFGVGPTVRAICEGVGIKSTSTVQKEMEILKEAGVISKRPKKHSYSLESEQPELKEEIVSIPVIGRVAAGQPILAESNIESYFPIPAGQMPKGDCFMLKVHGESMIEAGILNGDYILVQQQNTADNGEIVVAQVEGLESEATVKAFYKENGHIRLQPRNEAMDPIIVDDCKVIGKVRGVFRYLN